MKWSKLILWIVVGIIAAFIVWAVGFYIPLETDQTEAGPKVAIVTEPIEPATANLEKSGGTNELVVASDVDETDEKADVNEPQIAGANEPRGPAEPPGVVKVAVDVAEPNKPAEPNEPMEAVNLTNVEMKKIIQKLLE